MGTERRSGSPARERIQLMRKVLTVLSTSKEASFPDQYFPYLNQKNYQSPLVAVKLHNVEEGQLLHIECRAWAKNINYNRRDRVGIVHFELMAHSEATAAEVNKMARA